MLREACEVDVVLGVKVLGLGFRIYDRGAYLGRWFRGSGTAM